MKFWFLAWSALVCAVLISPRTHAAQLGSVQSGTATIANGSASTTATITSVTTSQAFVVFSARLGSGIVDPVDGQVSDR